MNTAYDLEYVERDIGAEGVAVLLALPQPDAKAMRECSIRVETGVAVTWRLLNMLGAKWLVAAEVYGVPAAYVSPCRWRYTTSWKLTLKGARIAAALRVNGWELHDAVQ